MSAKANYNYWAESEDGETRDPLGTVVCDESNDGLIVGPITESGLITENGRILVHKSGHHSHTL